MNPRRQASKPPAYGATWTQPWTDLPRPAVVQDDGRTSLKVGELGARPLLKKILSTVSDSGRRTPRQVQSCGASRPAQLARSPYHVCTVSGGMFGALVLENWKLEKHVSYSLI